MPLARRLVEPAARLVVVHRNAASRRIDIAERDLRFRHALLGGLAVPVERLFRVGLDTVAPDQHDRQIVLRDPLALLGGAAIPRDRSIEILWHARGGAVHRRELKLRAGMARFRGAAEPRSSRRLVARSPDSGQMVARYDQL